MGEQQVSKFSHPDDMREFTRCLLSDLRAMDMMLKEGMFESDVQCIGAEQELGIVGKDWNPSMIYDKILSEVEDEHLTTELSRFNVEINLDPQIFKGNCFTKMHQQLDRLLDVTKKAARKHGSEIILTGIIPTIAKHHLQFKHMTPNPRYKALNDIIKGKRKGEFELNIIGLDELMSSHPNILFEACNTSFQIHYQVPPDDFVELFNWAQTIAGPVLAASANSPLLSGKRLWMETRIALFQQSIDMRNTTYVKRDQEPRVTFGKHWLNDSVIELYRDSISRFNLLFATDSFENSVDILNSNKIPKLRALNVHSGTVYMWNRACYGISASSLPHLRIENRYIPAGPTTVDEMANAAFWLGLMAGIPQEYRRITKKMNFEDIRYNFYNAARIGLESNFRWLGDNIGAVNLILDHLLPIAYQGLEAYNVDAKDINRLLGIIETRVSKQINGATWILDNFNKLLHKSTPKEASIGITRLIVEMEKTGKPVHEWEDTGSRQINIAHKHFYTVDQAMSTDIPTVNEDDILELVVNFMVWRNVRYIAVENDNHELVGLVASRLLVKLLSEGWKDNLTVKDIMVSQMITVSPETSTADAIALMSEKNIGCLPVVAKKRLLGIITEREIVNIVNLTQKFQKS